MAVVYNPNLKNGFARRIKTSDKQEEGGCFKSIKPSKNTNPTRFNSRFFEFNLKNPFDVEILISLGLANGEVKINGEVTLL